MHLSASLVTWSISMDGQEINAHLCLRLSKRQVINLSLKPENRHLTSLSFWVKMQATLG